MVFKKRATYRAFSMTVFFKTKIKKSLSSCCFFFIFSYYKRWNQPSAIKVQLNKKKVEIKTIIDDIRQLIETYGSNHDENLMNT